MLRIKPLSVLDKKKQKNWDEKYREHSNVKVCVTVNVSLLCVCWNQAHKAQPCSLTRNTVTTKP